MKQPLIILLILALFACTDDIDKSNRYTFTGETVADFMLNRSEKYSHMITLMKRAGLFGLLSTYGQYTLFLPDNDAVEKFVAEQDSIYHATKDTYNPVWTGVISPYVEELSDSMATVIARAHVIEKSYLTADMGEGAIGKWNFNDRALSVSYKVVDERFYIMINNHSAIIDGDNQVENGIVHLIDKPIDPKYRTVSNQIAAHPFFSIFTQAISETGFESKVSATADLNYVPSGITTYSPAFTISINIPQYRYFKFTAFVEPDEVFHKYGIYTLDDLKAFAEKWYGTKEKGNYKNPENALYKFVAYHFVEGEIPYNRVVLSRSGVIDGEYFDNYYIPGMDLYNYYPTMQGTLLKALKPLSTTDGLNIYLNYSKRKIPYNFEMRNHTNVRIIELTEFTQMNERYANFVPNAGNGLIHPIDKILIYNEDEMVGNILNERMRFDIASLQPELSSNNIWHTDHAEIPIDYCKGIKTFSGKNSGVYCCGEYWNYNLNCIIFIGLHPFYTNNFDHAVLLPPVPPRTYEIRISSRGGSGLYNNRTTAKYQLYFDDKICGSPIPTHPIPTDPEIGWVADEDTYDNGVENDKHLRNKGWMKAPDSYYVYIDDKTGIRKTARSSYNYMRKIIHRQYIGKGEHWLRYRYIPPKYSENFFASDVYLDYLEFVPLHIVSDPTKPEDRH